MPPSCCSALNIQIQQGVVQGPTSFVEGDEADVAEKVLPGRCRRRCRCCCCSPPQQSAAL